MGHISKLPLCYGKICFSLWAKRQSGRNFLLACIARLIATSFSQLQMLTNQFWCKSVLLWQMDLLLPSALMTTSGKPFAVRFNAAAFVGMCFDMLVYSAG